MPINGDAAQDLLCASSRTVLSVAAQFEELKQSVLAFQGFDAISARGYFTPSEDEATRRLLVTYWQMRCALLEVVNELRAHGARSREAYDRLFLPGYAGALVLLDAARFLREQFHHQKLIRRKLNEPEPAFGIPAGVYDAIQQSWTRPRHAWELFDAARYYQCRQERWQELIRDPSSASMLELIDRLATRLKTRRRDFAKARLRCLTRECWSFLKRDVWGSALFQIQKAIGTLAAERYIKLGHQPSLPEPVRERLNKLLMPGDVLLVRKEHALTNYFLPGYWPHTALYIGDAQSLLAMKLDRVPYVADRMRRLLDCAPPESGRVLEAMKDGVHLRPMSSPYRSDSILVLRPKLARCAVEQALARALFHEGKEYDFSFDFTVSERLVCTEVIYRAYEGIEGIAFPLAVRAGRMTLAAADLVHMAQSGQAFGVAAAYVPKLSSELEVCRRAEELVRQVVRPRDTPVLELSSGEVLAQRG